MHVALQYMGLGQGGKGPKIAFTTKLTPQHLVPYIVRLHAQLAPLLGNINVSRPHLKGKWAQNCLFLGFGGHEVHLNHLIDTPPPSTMYCEAT